MPPLFPGVQFQHAVSLGADCEPAHQLRRAGRLTVRGLFDWLVTPLSSIPEILADEGARLGRDYVCVNNGTSVRCRAYDVLYHHEFPREQDGAVRFSAEAAERCRSKMVHKCRSLLQGCAPPGPILFIRCGPESDLDWDAHGAQKRPIQARELNAVARALDYRLPGLVFRILVIAISGGAELAGEGVLDSRIVVEPLLRRHCQGWKLSDGDWETLFTRIAFSGPALSTASPLEETLFWSEENQASPETHRTAADPKPAPEVLRALASKGRELWREGRAFEAVSVFAGAYEQGLRDEDFLQDYLGLLTGEARFAEVLQRCAELDAEGRRTSFRDLPLRAHAKLALQRDRTAEIAMAAEREASKIWLSPEALLAQLERASHSSEPFSFVRVGDGEARFLIATNPQLQAGLSAEEARALGEVVWSNWFGGSLAAQSATDIVELRAAYQAALDNADILGVADLKRISGDTGHFGYLATQEDWLRAGAGRRDARQRLTSAMNHHELDRLTPHLGRLLGGAPFVGVVSPHPDLARRLAAQFAIGRHASYVIPAEGRLATAEATRRQGAHFPRRYLEVIDSLEPPFPGAIFLVAAGLLGKIYCDRIKRLGGVALDVGSLADAWMGFDTRPGQLASITTLPDATSPREGLAPAHGLAACVSMAKTSSIALTQALRSAGWGTAAHVHYLGPVSLAFKQERLAIQPPGTEPMMDVALELAQRIKDPDRDLKIVTCVRDPIARLVAQFFAHRFIHTPSADIDLGEAEAGLLDWFDRQFQVDRSTQWLDDNLGSALGFDFRTKPFDRARRSIRYEGDGLRLLILRQEDEVDGKERELGWLLDRGRVPFLPVNVAEDRDYADAYRLFRHHFVAPHSWLQRFYETEYATHFYSSEEREDFIRRWSDRRISRTRTSSILTCGTQIGCPS